MKALILGGTGTLGTELANQLLSAALNEVTVLSRCELKQKQMSERFGNDVRLKYRLGDIRDKTVLTRTMDGAGFDVVFHVAALKHVDVIEENPEESVYTNVVGTINIADAAISAKIPHVVFSSTDKAVDPINAYGMSKALSEKILYRRNEVQSITKFSVFRWGNVIGSRGSALHAFHRDLKKDGVVFVTDPEMTRFWIRIEDAVSFMLSKYKYAPTNAAQMPEMKTASVSEIVRAVAKHLGLDSWKEYGIGMRRGEKIHEQMVSLHTESPLCSKDAIKFSDADLVAMVKEVIG